MRIFFAALAAVVMSGCMQSEIPGTYPVEIELVGGTATIEGTLIISKGILDVPPPTEHDRAFLGEWIEGDTIDANSCFILHAASEDPPTPMNVRLFDARIEAGTIKLPVEIYRTPLQTLEIVSLDFFANALGGEVVLHDQGVVREGRIHGLRSGPPTRQRCLEDLELFRATLRASLTPPADA